MYLNHVPFILDDKGIKRRDKMAPKWRVQILLQLSEMSLENFNE